MAKEPSESAFEKKIQEQTAATAFQLVWGWVEKLGQKAWDKHKVLQATKSYAENYRERHGAVHVLGMSKPVPLHEIYTAVRVVPRDFLGAFIHPDKMEEAFKESGRRHISFHKDKVEDGIVVANREQFLNLLGAPGAGKSTFLRRLGQEAMLARQPGEQIDPQDTKLSSRYEHALLPVYLELRALRTKSVDLIARITDEFALAGFPESQAFVEAALASGKLLVLLDGLDEVPNEKLDEVIDHIRGFVDKHARADNRFVTSCRTAHYKHAFPRFTDMVVADFSDEQIEKFARNWFSGFHDKQAETAENFIRVLKEPTNASALELARTPLLLTFLCITYDTNQRLPPTRSTLYREALNLLLHRWAASKRVHDEPVYRELNADLELDMLAEFAEGLFRENRFFFNRERITGHIRAFMSKELNAPKTLDAGRILEAIEVQQGLIVRRAQDTYSFSHLTIQEYLTAKEIWDEGELAWQELVRDHLLDARWAVVFELMVGMGKSDGLLRAMSGRIQQEFERLCNQDEGTKAIAEWIARAANHALSISAQRLVAGRLILFTLALARALSCDWFNDLARAGDLARALALARDLDVDIEAALHITADRTYICTRAGDLARASSLVRVRAIASDLTRVLVSFCLKYQLTINLAEAFKSVETYLAQPAVSFDEVGKILEVPMVTNFVTLLTYFSGCEFLIRCKRAAYRLSAETWDEVCDTILRLPPAS